MSTLGEARTDALEREMAPSRSRLSRTPGGPPPGAEPTQDVGLDRSLLREHAGSVVLAELIPGAAHELNNSLFAILGLVELLMADAEPDTRAHDRLALIGASAVEIRDVVRALLSLLPAPSEREESASFDQAVRDSVDLVRRFGLVKDVDVEERYPDAPLLAPGSARELRHASLGLVLAAVRAAGPGTHVCVEVSSEGQWVILGVDDLPARSNSLSLELSRVVAQRLGGDLVSPGRTGRGVTLRLPAVSAATL